MSTPGWSTRHLSGLCPCVRERFKRVKRDFEADGDALQVIETLRDLERQKHYKAIRVSKTLKSKHLPQPPNGLALAVDAAPKAYLAMQGWNPAGSLWARYHDLIEGHGLKSGYLQWGWDHPHAYLDKCECGEALRA